MERNRARRSAHSTGAGIPTLHNEPVTFIVSADQRVTDISIGYNFSACSGVKTFSGLKRPHWSARFATKLGLCLFGLGWKRPHRGVRRLYIRPNSNRLGDV